MVNQFSAIANARNIYHPTQSYSYLEITKYCYIKIV